MIPSYDRPRPGILTFLGIVSLIWSSMTLIGSVVGVLALLLVGAGSWFAGPVVGVVGTALAAVVLIWLAASSALSILLFAAGWKTVRDDPDGIRLHRLWAWISLALDLVGVMASGGVAANSWAGIAYAGAVLYFTARPEVLGYDHGDRSHAKPPTPAGWSDDLA